MDVLLMPAGRYPRESSKRNRIIEEWLRHEALGHRLDSLYAIRNAPPLGMAELGVHTGCKECDDASATRP